MPKTILRSHLRKLPSFEDSMKAAQESLESLSAEDKLAADKLSAEIAEFLKETN